MTITFGWHGKVTRRHNRLFSFASEEIQDFHKGFISTIFRFLFQNISVQNKMRKYTLKGI